MAVWRFRLDASSFCVHKRHPLQVVLGVLFGIVLGVSLSAFLSVNTAAAYADQGDAAFVNPARILRHEDIVFPEQADRPNDGPPPGLRSKSREVPERKDSSRGDHKQSNHQNSISEEEEPTGNYRSPVESLFRHHFKNAAVEREVRKHDRFVIESLAYLADFDDEAAAAYGRNEAPSSAAIKPITILVLTVNRAVPYLAVLVSLLLRGHSPAVFMKNIDLHIVNIERRKGRRGYYLFEELREKMPFISFHDWTADYPQHSDLKSTYIADQRLDYVRSLRLCEASGSRWCVVLEDDAIVPVDFAGKFLRYVDRDVFQNAGKTGSEDITLERVFMVKLYTPFMPLVGERWKKRGGRWGKIFEEQHNATHQQLLYDSNRALDYNEAHEAGVPAKKIVYEIRSVDDSYGIVAIAYPSVGLNRTIAFLEKDNSRGAMPTDISLGGAFELMKSENLVRLGTVPSLVNHLGFYSDHYKSNWYGKGISTDIRFQLDDGPDLKYE